MSSLYEPGLTAPEALAVEAQAAQFLFDESIRRHLRLLAHPTRQRLLLLLHNQEDVLAVQEICTAIGQVTQPTISYHLRMLRHAGFVDYRKQGHYAYYYLCRERLAQCSEQLVVSSHLLRALGHGAALLS